MDHTNSRWAMNAFPVDVTFVDSPPPFVGSHMLIAGRIDVSHCGQKTALFKSSDEVRSPLSELRVLYVDDAPAVLESIKRLMEHHGFSVAGYSDQVEAIEALRMHVNDFDLVVTDYNMPRISGIEFAKMVRALRADLPIVIITGLIDDVLRTEAALIGVQELIAKPFSLKGFSDTLRRAAAKTVQRSIV